MEPVRITLVQLGQLNCGVDMNALSRWKSKVFKVARIERVRELPNTDLEDWAYSDVLLGGILADSRESDVLIGITCAKLEGNYYIRRLGKNTAVISLFEIADILRHAGLKNENFLLRTLYEISLAYYEMSRAIPATGDPYELPHDDTRGCIYDMCGNKTDIVVSVERPRVCDECRSRVSGRQLPEGVLGALEKELKRIRRDLYSRIGLFLRRHTVWALLIGLAGSIVVGIVSNAVFSLVVEPWLRSGGAGGN